jgi:iron(II)-dependent oxidoreductase
LIAVQEFRAFMDDGGYQKKVFWSKEGWSFRSSTRTERPMDWDEQLLFPNCPVTGVSWYEAQAFCTWATLLHRKAGLVYTLPSEAQWEYALRRNIPPGRRFLWGDHLQDGDKAEANWDGCRLRKKSPVGMFADSDSPDGISDMIGNVEEWCADAWIPSHVGRPPDGSSVTNPGENRRVVRGGSTIRVLRLCRPTYRSRTAAQKRYHTIGFRPVRTRLGIPAGRHPAPALNAATASSEGRDMASPAQSAKGADAG